MKKNLPSYNSRFFCNFKHNIHFVMKRVLIILFNLLSCVILSQVEIHVTDAIPKKAVLVMPTVTAGQLNTLKTEFEKYDQITNAVFVFKGHNCLLINFQNNGSIKFYSDLLKIIQSSVGITMNEILLKTPEAFNEIMQSADTVSSTIIK